MAFPTSYEFISDIPDEKMDPPLSKGAPHPQFLLVAA